MVLADHNCCPMNNISNNTQSPWWKDPGIRQLNFLLLACYLGAMTNGYISSLMSSLITNPRWTRDLEGLSDPILLGFVVAAQPLGCIAAFIPAPWLSERYGRRTFCKNAIQFLLMRLIVGFASTFNTLSSSALVLELAHPRQRAVIGALFNTFCIAQLALIIWCPESPRWLVAVGRKEQAKALLFKYHANGDQNDQLVLLEYSSICASAEADQRSRAAGWYALLSTPGNRRRLMLSIVIGINGGLQIYTWLLAFGAALLAERAGRRRLFLTSVGTMLFFMSIVALCSALYSSTRSLTASYAVIICLFLFFGGYVIGLTPIPILYVNEIWPSRLRAKGTSVFWFSQAVATCFNQYVNPVALQRISWKYYLVYVGVLVVPSDEVVLSGVSTGERNEEA
ncbi:MFS general substrate transporter [Periconia macrospinosa]|uniref:MFS general substrate transporter n=1 Tax=Periconia macrospinosa TaxID=97972 RepID=A0A2V1CYL3_9PLEO|nr:MFS general substrate transporter [Periconia macrospinosa]